MAVGDRIAIADKTTLDNVLTKANTIETLVRSSSKESNNFIQPSELNKFHPGSRSVSASTTSSVLSVTGSGVFYYALFQNNVADSNTSSCFFQIDFGGGNRIAKNYNYSNSINFNGFVDISLISSSNNNSYRVPAVNGGINLLEASVRAFQGTINESLWSNIVYLLPCPIRFTNGFNIYLNSNVATSMYYYYKLD